MDIQDPCKRVNNGTVACRPDSSLKHPVGKVNAHHLRDSTNLQVVAKLETDSYIVPHSRESFVINILSLFVKDMGQKLIQKLRTYARK